MKCALKVLFGLALGYFVLADDLRAESFPLAISGHLKYQASVSSYPEDSLFSELGPDTASFHEVDLRLNSEYSTGNLKLIAQAEALSLSGSGVSARKKALGFSPFSQRRELLIEDERRAFDATLDFIDKDNAEAVLRLDRLSLRYSSERFVARLGRQALSWGNGLVFSVLDIFNPFSPTEVDKDYKTGDDMLFVQHLLGMNADLQFALVARRNSSRALSANASSLAAKYHQRIEELALDLDLLLARHYDESFFGLALNRTLFEGVLRLDLSYSDSKTSSEGLSLLANYDRSYLLWGYNLYAYLEYFRSGFGVSDGDYLSIENELARRIARGELFLLARDYLAAGLSVELSALLVWWTPVIFNLDDESAIVQQRLECDIGQNTSLLLGLDIPIGPSGSEFGGIELEPSGLEASSGVSSYLRISYFF